MLSRALAHVYPRFRHPPALEAAAGASSLSSSAERRKAFALHLVTDDLWFDHAFYDKIQAAVEGGVTCVQLRLKQVNTARFVEAAERVKKITEEADVPLIIDDRLDVALAVEADGLHVGAEDLPWRAARRLLGPHRILGCSTYGKSDLVEEALSTEVSADYLGSGTVFISPTKHSSTPQGPGHLRGMKALIASKSPKRDVPLIAIGGVRLENTGDCIQKGADGVAVVSSLLSCDTAKATREAAAKMLQAIHESWQIRGQGL